MTPASMHERLGHFARDLKAQETPDDTLQGVVDAALDLVEPCRAAGISLVHRRHGITTSATTSDIPRRGDDLQMELQQGPCMDAVWEHRVISSPDLQREPRWPLWAPRAVAELGVRSMLCLRLFTHEDRVGALNLYAFERHAFDGDDVEAGEAVAAHAAVAVASAQEMSHLQLALDNRTVIGQATGLVMGYYDLDSAAAFAVLRRLSSHENKKVAVLAADLVRQHDASPGDRHRP